MEGRRCRGLSAKALVLSGDALSTSDSRDCVEGYRGSGNGGFSERKGHAGSVKYPTREGYCSGRGYGEVVV